MTTTYALLLSFATLAGCGGDPTVDTGSGAGGHATHTTTSASTTSSTSTTTAPACSAAACVPGSYDVCDDASTPLACCNAGAPSSECHTPAGILVHSAACDAICPPSGGYSCALSPMKTLTCCAPISACNEVVP